MLNYQRVTSASLCDHFFQAKFFFYRARPLATSIAPQGPGPEGGESGVGMGQWYLLVNMWLLYGK